MSPTARHCHALAENLIETLGPDRAVHVANQFGWYGVAQEIALLCQKPRRPAPLSDEAASTGAGLIKSAR